MRLKKIIVMGAKCPCDKRTHIFTVELQQFDVMRVEESLFRFLTMKTNKKKMGRNNITFRVECSCHR